MCKKFFTFLLIFFVTTNLYADLPHYIDFKFILNESDAGKKAQSFLKKKLEGGVKSLKDKESKIQDEEKKLIQQKKVISAEEALEINLVFPRLNLILFSLICIVSCPEASDRREHN